MDNPIVRRAAFATLSLAWTLLGLVPGAQGDDPPPIRVGIIGLDTSHVIHFTKLLNSDNPPAEVAGCRVVAAYPHGSLDIESSVSRIPQYTADVKKLGVEIVGSIDELLERVDAVLLETNDGRRHLAQALPVLKAGKRMFIDKPMAASLEDVIAIFAAADHFDTPVFSTSALRYGKGTLAVHQGAIGEVLGCNTYSSCNLEASHPDFFWYGIHGVEALFTVMGSGCKTVSRVHTEDQDVATGVWEGGRIGTYRGMRVGHRPYGGMAFGTTGNMAVGSYDGYEPLVFDIVRFFRGGDPSVSKGETIDIFAFMEAADESKRNGGKPVGVGELISAATTAAMAKRTW